MPTYVWGSSFLNCNGLGLRDKERTKEIVVWLSRQKGAKSGVVGHKVVGWGAKSLEWVGWGAKSGGSNKGNKEKNNLFYEDQNPKEISQ